MRINQLPKTAVTICCCAVVQACALLGLGAPAYGQADTRPEDPAAIADDWLVPARWGEVRYGLTIREPKNAFRLETPRDGSLVRWVMPDQAHISLEIHQGLMADRTMRQGIEIEDGVIGGARLVDATAMQPLRLDTLVRDLTAAIETAGVKEIVNSEIHEWIEIGGYIGYLNYFAVYPRGEDSQPWLYGIALLKIDDLNVIVMRLECQSEATELGIHTFEAMLHSIELEPIQDVLQRLRDWMAAGDEVLASLTLADRLAVMQPDRLFRIRELGVSQQGTVEDTDIGYTRVWQRYQDRRYYRERAEELQAQDPDAFLAGVDAFRLQGCAVVIQTYLHAHGNEVTRLQEYIQADADEGIDEVWNFKTQLRQPGEGRYGRDEGVWVETGVRDDIHLNESTTINRIEIVREGTPPRQIMDYVLARERSPEHRLRFPSARPEALPAGDVNTTQWQTPDRGYLSQVDAILMPALLPADREQTYGFFVYNPESSNLAIRVMHVVPTPVGGKIVYVRPTIDLAAQAMEFDHHGELVRWLFPDGRSLVRTTREELARLWKVQLPRH